MFKMPLFGNLVCKLTTVFRHIQRCFTHRKEESKDWCDIKGYKHRKQWKCYYTLFGQLYFRVLIWWRNNMSFFLCTYIWIIKFYKYQVCNYCWILHTKGKGEWCGFWQLPLCFSAGIKPFQWEDYLNKAGRKSLFLPSRRFCHHFGERDRVFWLSCAASSYGLHRMQKPTQAAKTASSQGSFTPKVGGSPNNSLRAVIGGNTPWVSPLMHISKALHPDPKTHFVF